MKTLQHSQESLCRSYLTAVAAVARHNLTIHSEHDYGVDGQFRLVETRGTRVADTGFCIDFQAKASIRCARTDEHITYDLEVQAYNDLVARSHEPRSIPFFLIVLSLPETLAQWLHVDEDNLILRNCAYFLQLSGEFSTNQKTERVKIPRGNHLTPTTLVNLLHGVKAGTVKS